MSQNLAHSHLINRISLDGPYPKLEELQLVIENSLIEIKLMTRDQDYKVNVILRIKQLRDVILDQVIEDIPIGLGNLRIRCKEEQVLSFIIQSFE